MLFSRSKFIKMDSEELIEEAPTFMSEEEVQSMISSFQSALSIFTQELENLNAKNEELHSNLQYELTRDAYLTDEQEKLNIKYQHTKTELDSCNEKINTLEISSNQGKSLALNSGKSESYRRASDDLFSKNLESQEIRDQIIAFIMNLEQEIANLESENRRAKENNQKLRNEIDIVLEDEKTNHRCKNCKKEFVPKQNKEGECSFHPGKLKYYSCKGCGDDAYYTCCNRCIKCSTGCRNGRHISI